MAIIAITLYRKLVERQYRNLVERQPKPVPVVGEATLRDLLREAKANEQAFRSRVRTVLTSSYTNHYRRMLRKLLAALVSRCNNVGFFLGAGWARVVRGEWRWPRGLARRVPRPVPGQVEGDPAGAGRDPGGQVDEVGAQGGHTGACRVEAAAPAARSTLNERQARVSQAAAFAVNFPEGACARGPSLSSAMTCSTMAWSRCRQQSRTIARLRLRRFKRPSMRPAGQVAGFPQHRHLAHWAFAAPGGFGLVPPSTAGRPPVCTGIPSTAAPYSGVYLALLRKVSTNCCIRGSVALVTCSW